MCSCRQTPALAAVPHPPPAALQPSSQRGASSPALASLQLAQPALIPPRRRLLVVTLGLGSHAHCVPSCWVANSLVTHCGQGSARRLPQLVPLPRLHRLSSGVAAGELASRAVKAAFSARSSATSASVLTYCPARGAAPLSSDRGQRTAPAIARWACYRASPASARAGVRPHAGAAATQGTLGVRLWIDAAHG